MALDDCTRGGGGSIAPLGQRSLDRSGRGKVRFHEGAWGE